MRCDIGDSSVRLEIGREIWDWNAGFQKYSAKQTWSSYRPEWPPAETSNCFILDTRKETDQDLKRAVSITKNHEGLAHIWPIIGILMLTNHKLWLEVGSRDSDPEVFRRSIAKFEISILNPKIFINLWLCLVFISGFQILAYKHMKVRDFEPT